jgi:hypothetical protein
MKKIIILVLICLFTIPAFGKDLKKTVNKKPVNRENLNITVNQIQSVCIEGHVFIYVFCRGDRRIPAVSLQQVYIENKKGKVVPKKCEQ